MLENVFVMLLGGEVIYKVMFFVMLLLKWLFFVYKLILDWIFMGIFEFGEFLLFCFLGLI